MMRRRMYFAWLLAVVSGGTVGARAQAMVTDAKATEMDASPAVTEVRPRGTDARPAVMDARPAVTAAEVMEGIVEHGVDAVEAVCFYDEPLPELLEIAPSGRLSRNQAIFDLMALIYHINEVHPDMFSGCNQADLMGAFNKTVASLPDSLSVVDLYRYAAPIVAMIGDGHTAVNIPTDDIIGKMTKRLPIVGNLNRRVFTCLASPDSVIPKGARIVKINGMEMNAMIDSMLPYISGEREHFKLTQVSRDFQWLHQMLFGADEYVVEFLPDGESAVETVTLPAMSQEEMKGRVAALPRRPRRPDYVFVADSVRNVAVMEFNRFHDPKRMEHFADSMFTELRDKGITNLIIDLRHNGGGNSDVGDVLLRYISDVPFTQFEKMLVKVTPETIKLMKGTEHVPGLFFIETDSAHLVKPRTREEGHFEGNVYLLTSNYTYSSASSFAWAFKVCDMGVIVGEETGGMNVAYGDVLKYTLPISKLESIISYKRFWKYKADENDIHGAMPDVEVPAERALEAALELIRRGN